MSASVAGSKQWNNIKDSCEITVARAKAIRHASKNASHATILHYSGLHSVLPKSYLDQILFKKKRHFKIILLFIYFHKRDKILYGSTWSKQNLFFRNRNTEDRCNLFMRFPFVPCHGVYWNLSINLWVTSSGEYPLVLYRLLFKFT